MLEKFTLNAELRSDSDIGKGASRRLRNKSKVPGIVYGAHQAAQPIILDHKEIRMALENEAFYSHILTLNLKGKQAEKVILKDLQRHPFKPRIAHVDLQRISEKEAITMRIPLHFIGGSVAPGVKKDGGSVSHLQSDILVRCLPANLPEYVEVDISSLELNATIHLSDLKLPKDIEIVDLAHEDRPVVTIYVPRAVVEPTEVIAPSAVPSETGGEAAAAPAAATAEAKGKEGGKEKGKG